MAVRGASCCKVKALIEAERMGSQTGASRSF